MTDKSQDFRSHGALHSGIIEEKIIKRTFWKGYSKTFVTKVLEIFQGLLVFVDQFVDFIINRNVSRLNDVVVYARPPILFGLYVIFIFIICGGYWAVFAPLDSAAHANGVVIATVDKQRIHHVQGGKVRKIFVKQGDIVNEGQVLMELCSPEARANYEIYLNNYLDVLACQNRLVAQRDGAAQIAFDEMLVKNSKQERIEKLLSIQNKIFREMQDSHKNKINLHQQEIQKCIQKRDSLNAQIEYAKENFKFVTEQLKVSLQLEKDGFASRSDSEKLLSEQARGKSILADNLANQANLEKEILCLEIKIQEEHNNRFHSILRELKETQSKLSEVKEQYNRVKETFDSQIIVSPMRGVVTYLVRKSLIHPQSEIGGVTPIRSHLVVEAKVSPQDIGSVRVGQQCKVKFTAFKSRTSPLFNGVVTSISPDTMEEIGPRGERAQLYVARLEMDKKELDEFLEPRGMELIPGMQASVNIVTGTRSLFRYLMDPVLDQTFKAFKER